MSYVVSAQKSTSINQAATGNFTSPNDINLIISKRTHLEIFTVTEGGLQPLMDSRIFGRISFMKLIKIKEFEKELLFLFTESYKFCVLSYDNVHNQIVTEISGDVSDISKNDSQNGQFFAIDPELRVIGLHLYQGSIVILPIQKIIQYHFVTQNKQRNQRKESTYSFNLRLNELNVMDIAFLYNSVKPTMVILSLVKEHSYAKLYEISVEKKELNGPKEYIEVEYGAKMIIPIKKPIGGLIIVGEKSITHYNNNLKQPLSIPINNINVNCYCPIDDEGYRYLFGDYLGSIYLLILFYENGNLTGMKVERLGKTSIPSCLTYIDCGFVFAGSHFGDSQLIHLQSEPSLEGNYFEVIDSMTSLSPITDFCLVDLEKQGQGQMVVCSGGFDDGSLRVIRVGVGINEIATLNIEGLKGIFSIRPSFISKYVDIVALSFYNATRFLVFSMSNNLIELENSSFITDESTILFSNMFDNNIIQVIPSKIILFNNNYEIISVWNAPQNTSICLASSNPTQVIVSLNEGHLLYFQVENNEIVLKNQIKFENEISCLDITSTNVENKFLSTNICCIGFWNEISIKLLSIPELQIINSNNIGGDIIPRSILFSKLDDTIYLFVALGDGQLICYHLDTYDKSLKYRSKFSLGTQPINLKPFISNNKNYIFAASDQPTIIYSNNNSLNFSNVNLKEVIDICPFNNQIYGDALCFLTNETIKIGTIDEIQRLHIRKIPLYEHPRRLCYQESSKTFGVLTMKVDGYNETHYFRIIDDQTYDILDSNKMMQTEFIQSILSMKFENDPKEYYIIGTSFIEDDKEESSSGRLLLFTVTDIKQLRLEYEISINGSPWSINEFKGKLVVGIRNKIFIYQWIKNEEGEMELTTTCKPIFGKTLPISIETHGNDILVGDIINSLTLMNYDENKNEIVEVACDIDTRWISAVSFIGDNIYLGGDTESNIFTFERSKKAICEYEKKKLNLLGEFHLGSNVNRYRPGKLVSNKIEGKPITSNEIIYATVDGSIGIIAQIPPEIYSILNIVQDNIIRIINNVGNFSYKEWRKNQSINRVSDTSNFIDGDIIENFLDLDQKTMQSVINGENGGEKVNCSVNDLIKIIEKLGKLH